MRTLDLDQIEMRILTLHGKFDVFCGIWDLKFSLTLHVTLARDIDNLNQVIIPGKYEVLTSYIYCAVQCAEWNTPPLSIMWVVGSLAFDIRDL